MTAIYGIKTCDTCRKAAKTLGVELHDIRAEPLAVDQIERFFAAFGEALVNTRSATWRAMDSQTRDLSPVALICAHPTVMKRPVIDHNGVLHLGWGKEVQAALGVLD